MKFDPFGNDVMTSFLLEFNSAYIKYINININYVNVQPNGQYRPTNLYFRKTYSF